MADTEVCPEIYGKRFLKNDTDDLHIKLSDGLHHIKWRMRETIVVTEAVTVTSRISISKMKFLIN